MLRWIQKHYIVSFLLLLIFVLCALHLSGTRNEARILPKQGVIIEKDIAVDINRNPTAALKILSASNYSESYTIDVLPILKQYNCYIVDYLIINEELYLLGCSNDTIPIYENMMLFWNVKTDEMERYENLKSITSFNIKYMDMNYDTKRFERWNQIINSVSPKN